MPKRQSTAAASAKKPVKVVVEQADLRAVRADLLVVDAFEGAESLGGVSAVVDKASGGPLARVLAAGDFKGKFKETVLVHPTRGSAKRVMLVGLGQVDKLTVDHVRRVAAVIARRARDLGVKEVHCALPGVGRPAGAKPGRVSGGASAAASARGGKAKPVDGGPALDPAAVGEAFAEGALLGLYTFDFYKGTAKGAKGDVAKGAKKPELARIVLVEKHAAHAKAAREGVARGAIIAEATNLCRDYAAYSSDEAAPERYGERAKTLAREHGLTASVLGKREIQALGMGGLLAVNQGSVREPRFVVLEHAPRGAKHTVCLVGKGICFDSGGISIKPSDKMEDMKMDKSGASAVIGAVVAAARLKLPVRVVAIAPFTDNLPSGSAYKPGDIVRTMNGKTIEVVNTDAEGRVILADALHYATRYDPAAVVELSTLTGACPIAVGHLVIAGMGNSDALMAQLQKAGAATMERVHPLPFLEEYGEMVKSKVADVKNSAGRIGGSITAGKFLENFIGDHPWVHLDIAATAWHEGPTPRFNDEYTPEYATGVGVRLLVRWLRDFEAPTWTPKPKKDSGAPRAEKDRRTRNRRADQAPARVAS
jgi:leucyl aminopeptidase